MTGNRISIQDAAEIMGVTLTYLREGIARGKFNFGTEMTLKENGKRRTFYINKRQFYEEMRIQEEDCSFD